MTLLPALQHMQEGSRHGIDEPCCWLCKCVTSKAAAQMLKQATVAPGGHRVQRGVHCGAGGRGAVAGRLGPLPAAPWPPAHSAHCLTTPLEVHSVQHARYCRAGSAMAACLPRALPDNSKKKSQCAATVCSLRGIAGLGQRSSLTWKLLPKGGGHITGSMLAILW